MRAELEHRAAMASLTAEQRRAIARISKAKAMPGHPAENLKKLFKDEDAAGRP